MVAALLHQMKNDHSLQQELVLSVYFIIMCQNGTKSRVWTLGNKVQSSISYRRPA